MFVPEPTKYCHTKQMVAPNQEPGAGTNAVKEISRHASEGKSGL